MKKNKTIKKRMSIKKDTILFLIKDNFFPFLLGLTTVFISFVLAVILLIRFYNPAEKNSIAVITPLKIATPTLSFKKHIVRQGETLFLIAQKYYGDGYLMYKIIEANNIINPDVIEVGTELTIP